jgi:hypothetical protein
MAFQSLTKTMSDEKPALVAIVCPPYHGTSEPRPNGVGCSQNGVARYRPTLLRETGHLREKAEKEEGRKTEEKDPGAERRISGES